jgi:metallophosphoesterase superfamily enzyme
MASKLEKFVSEREMVVIAAEHDGDVDAVASSHLDDFAEAIRARLVPHEGKEEGKQ